MKEGKVFKRILAIALVVVMTITMMPFGVFATGETATETPETCEHPKANAEYKAKVEPTCTEDGVSAHFLCPCGVKVQYPNATTVQVVDDAYLKINKLGHDLADATCTEPKKCQRTGCEETEGEALGHSFTNYVAKNDATCTADGTKVAKCDRCDETDTIADVGSKLAHSFTNYTSDNNATCITDGTKTAKCDNCDETDTVVDVDSKIDHTWDEGTITTPATCRAMGVKTFTCKTIGCNETKTEDIAIDPSAHSWDAGEVTKNPTCNAKGEKTFKCTNGACKEKKVEDIEIDANAHSWNDGEITTPATCKTVGVKTFTCANCNKTKTEDIPTIEHTWSETDISKDDAQHGKKCSKCGDFKDLADHEFVVKKTTPATCVATGLAEKECACGAKKNETLPIDENAHNVPATATFEKVSATQHGKLCPVCNEYTALADHAYTKEIAKKLATCVTEGSVTNKCVCGDTKTETLPVNDNHDWGAYTETLAATCTEKGTKEAACKREGCAEKDIQEIPALGHDMEEVAAKEATCKEAGNNKYYACDRCDKFFKDEAGAIETTVEAETIAKGEHKFTKYNVVKDATCEANAVEKATCDVCEEATHERPIPGTMLAHTFKDYKSDGNATCKADGTMTAVCEMCKEAKDTKTEVDSHKTAPHTPDAAGVKCTLCGEMLVCLHTYSAEKLITKTPTCTVEGQKAIVCSKCKANKPGSEEVIPATGHAWDEGEVIKAATCKEKGTMKHKCNNKCGETKTEEIAVVPHNYKEEITHATCTEDGYSTFTCTMCGSHYVDKPVEAYGHMFDIYFYDEGSATCYQDGTKTAECANGCGTKNTIADPGSKTDHEMTDFTVIKAATCTEDGEEEAKCFYYDKCGYSELVPVDALGHDIPADFVTVTEPTCTEKGLKTKTCTRCPETVATEEIPALGHDIAAEYTVDVAPTCTTTGKQSKHCSRCDYKESEEEIPATGHNYKPGEGTTATCTEPGKAVYVCTVCGDSYSEDSVPALGHDFDYVSDGNATCTADGTKTGKCIRCDVTSTVADEGSKLEHVLETTVEKASTEKAGLKITKCANCEYEESVEIAKIESLKLKYEVVAYDGKYKRPSLTITDADGNKLVKGEDYILDLPAKDECINAGTYTYTVYFQGDYEGEETLSYKIVPGKANKIVSKGTKQTSIALKWSTVKGADGYRIYVKTSSGGWKKLATVKGKTTYTVKDLKAGTKYTFAVKAFSKSEDGETTIWATEFAQQSFKTLPGKTSKIAVKTSKNAVKLTWKEVKGAEGYRVYVKTAKGGWKTVSTVKGKTNYTIKDLKANTTYEYAVKAYYKDGSATVWSNQYTTVKAKTAK